MKLDEIEDRADSIAFLAKAGSQTPEALGDLIEKLADLVKEVARSRTQGTRRFSPPTADEVRKFCVENDVDVDADRFVNYYESQGWKKANGVPLKNWKAAIRTWNRRNKSEDVPI